MVQLRGLWNDALCLVTMAVSGLLTVQPPHQTDQPSVEQLRSTPQTPRIAFLLPMEITNRVFTDTLLNPASDEYQTLYKDVSDLLKSIFDCPDHNTCPTDVFYGGVTAMTFSPGSVIATPTVVFNTYFINPSIIHYFFTTKANSVQPHILQLNLDFTTKDKITLPTTTTTTTTTLTPETTTTTTTIAATPTPAATSITTTTSTETPLTKTTTTTATLTTASTVTPTTRPATSTAPTTPSSTTTTILDLTTSSTNAKTSSDHRAAVSTTKTIHGNRGGSFVTTARRKGLWSGLQATTVDPHNKHTHSSGKANDVRAPGDIQSNESCDWIPGWGSALLVLAAAILLLLIIVFIMMLVQWCCKKTENGLIGTHEDSRNFETKQLPHDPLPACTPPAPVTQRPGSASEAAEDVPRKNRFYAVNP